ncbi:MAG: hypothetical protein M1379_08800 [Firmicutes bacterium]|nr:hypothetical protein [Bacillota bacterium]
MALRTKSVEEKNLLTRLLRGNSYPGRPILLTRRAWGSFEQTAALGGLSAFFVHEAIEPWQSALERFGLAGVPDAPAASGALGAPGVPHEPGTPREVEQEEQQQPPRQPDFKKELGLIFLGLELEGAIQNGSVIEVRAIEKPGRWETAIISKKAVPRGRVYFAIYNANGQKLAWQSVNL